MSKPTKYKDVIKRLAFNCRLYRNELGFSQEKTAERAGLYLRHYQKIEAEEVNVTVFTLCQLAKALETTPTDLLF